MIQILLWVLLALLALAEMASAQSIDYRGMAERTAPLPSYSYSEPPPAYPLPPRPGVQWYSVYTPKGRRVGNVRIDTGTGSVDYYRPGGFRWVPGVGAVKR
jgi:hypothetical protein